MQTETGLTLEKMKKLEIKLLAEGYISVDWTDDLRPGEYAVSNFSGDALTFDLSLEEILYCIKYEEIE